MTASTRSAALASLSVALVLGCASYRPPPAVAPRPAAQTESTPDASACTEASALLGRAEKHLGRLETAEARRFLGDAERRLAGNAAPCAGALTRDVWVFLAVADLAQEHPAGARAHLVRVAESDPAHTIDPGRVPPEVIALLAEVRANVSPQKPRMPRRPTGNAMSWGPGPGQASVPEDHGADRPWYRTGWCWGVLGAAALISAGYASR